MGNFISWIKTNIPDPGNGDPSQGEAREGKNQPQSISGMVSTLVPVLVMSGVYIIIFLLIRYNQKRFYAPRTYLGSLRENERSPELPKGLFNWIGSFWKMPDAYALQHQSLDAYLFLRYLRICTTICFVSLCITWPILFPVNATGGNGLSQLEILSYSNVDVDKNGTRLFAHALVAWVVYGMVIYMITRECIFFINLRQAYLLTPQYAKRISSRTVLFTAVPDEFLNGDRLRQVFGADAVKNVWVAGLTKDLDDAVEERDKVAMTLEKGEIKLLKAVNKARIAAAKKDKSGAAPDVARDTEHGSLASRWITDKMRPTHRTGKFGLIGKKVDTVEWGRTELHTLVPKVEAMQADFAAGKYEKVNSVFVEFYTQSDAQAAAQVVTHHHALHMSPRFIGVKPDEVVWKNLSISWWQKVIRRYLAVLFIALLVIFWAIPVGIVGIIAQVNTLKSLPGLTWIGDIPPVILGVVSGLLPSVALSILMSLVPIIMRALAKFAGEVSLSRVELFTQNAYFTFQIVQVFLIRTLTDTASTAIINIAQDPSSIFGTLGEAIPTSSNFYISYFIVQGLSIATSTLTQVVGCVIFNLMYKFLATTPRAMYTKWTTLSAVLWGSLLPVYSAIAVISITYSVIAPLMLFWSTLGLGFFYLAYRYNILFVSDTQVDTRGLFYPRALKHLFVGVYIAEICMIGLFSVSKAGGPAALMAVFLIFTIIYHRTLSKSLDPLLYNLPRTLQVEEELLQARASASDPEVVMPNESNEETGTNGKSNLKKLAPGGADGGVQKKGNFLAKWLKPWIFADYATLRHMVPNENVVLAPVDYTEEVERNAYWPPSVTSSTPVLWIPQDPLGVSKQEIALTGKVIPISDEGATLNDKNKVEWDAESARPPIWSEKVYY